MVLVYPTRTIWVFHAQGTIIPGAIIINPPHHPKISTRDAHPSLREKLHHRGMDVQGII